MSQFKRGYVRWDSLPRALRRANEPYLKPGHFLYRPKLDRESYYRQIRAFFAEELQTSRNRTDAVLVTAEEYQIHERTVWRIISNVHPGMDPNVARIMDPKCVT